MADKKGFVYAFGWNSYYRNVLGICSLKGEGFLERQKGWAWAILMLIFIWMPQAASFQFLRSDLNSMIDCLSTNMGVSLAIAKLIVLEYQRDVIGSILDTIGDDWTDVKAKSEKSIMLETARISRFISIISVSLTNIMFFEYVVSQLWILVRNDHSKIDPRLSFGMLQTSYFPFDTTKLITFIPLWIGQFFATVLSMISYSGADSIVSMMVLHVCGQLKIIRYYLKNLVNETTMREPEIFWTSLTDIVLRHDQLNDLVTTINDTFSTILLVQMVVCSVIFCFQGYAMFTNLMDHNSTYLPVFDIGFCVIYSIFTVTHLFIYCYVGDRLLVESISISDAFYETAWYNLSPKEARAFLFVCHRSNIPLQLNAGKFCVFNLQLFNAIMKTSMGYLSMLMAMKERLID